MMLETIKEGKALKKFEEMLISQGVSDNVAKNLVDCENENFPHLPKSESITRLTATKSGLYKIL